MAHANVPGTAHQTVPPAAERNGGWATCSERFARWFADLHFDRLPADVVENTGLHNLDVIGLALLVGTQPFGEIVRRATLAMGG